MKTPNGHMLDSDLGKSQDLVTLQQQPTGANGLSPQPEYLGGSLHIAGGGRHHQWVDLHSPRFVILANLRDN